MARFARAQSVRANLGGSVPKAPTSSALGQWQDSRNRRPGRHACLAGVALLSLLFHLLIDFPLYLCSSFTTADGSTLLSWCQLPESLSVRLAHSDLLREIRCSPRIHAHYHHHSQASIASPGFVHTSTMSALSGELWPSGIRRTPCPIHPRNEQGVPGLRSVLKSAG